MIRFKLSTFLLVSLIIAIAAASAGRSYFNQIAALERSKSTNSLVDEMVQSFSSAGLSSADVQKVVDHAASSERSVLFIDLAWSLNSTVGRRPFAHFIVEFQNSNPNNPVMFHYVDCTAVANGYAPFRSLPGWKDLETNGQSLIHGNGEIVWMRRGKVVRVEQISNFRTTANLVDLTERIFRIERER